MKKFFDGRIKINSCFFFVFVTLIIFNVFTAFSQTSFNNLESKEASLAETEFRRGVQAYYRNAFNDSVMQFEKALSYLPDENLILDWLGKAYYRSGIEGAALQQWKFASEAGYGGLLLKNRFCVCQL